MDAIMQGSVGQWRQTQIELITKVAWFSAVYSGNSDLVRASHPRTAEASGICTTTGRILFYNS